MLSKSSLKITEANISSLEKLTGYNFPTDFANFYLSSNGGVPDKSYFYIDKDEDFVEISFFIPIYYANNSLGDINIELSYKNLIAKGIPGKYLPFAVDWGGNYFSLDLETDNIVLLLMDLGNFTNNCIKHLTTGFLNFINDLQEVEDEED